MHRFVFCKCAHHVVDVELSHPHRSTGSAYRTPKRKTPAHIVSTKVDVYGAGIMFGYMFSFIEPWQGIMETESVDTKDVFVMAVDGMRPVLEPPAGAPGRRKCFANARTVPPRLKEIISAMVQQDPYLRPSFKEVAHQLSDYLELSRKRTTAVVSRSPAKGGLSSRKELNVHGEDGDAGKSAAAATSTGLGSGHEDGQGRAAGKGSSSSFEGTRRQWQSSRRAQSAEGVNTKVYHRIQAIKRQILKR